MSLPDGTATRFLLHIRANHPDVRVILATGGSPPDELQSEEISVLTKPFSDKALRDMVGT